VKADITVSSIYVSIFLVNLKFPRKQNYAGSLKLVATSERNTNIIDVINIFIKV
jgi:hypothetical protein